MRDSITGKRMRASVVDCTTCWPAGIRLTFSGVQLCSGYNWPACGNVNQSWDLPFVEETSNDCLYVYMYGEEGHINNCRIGVRIIKANCSMAEVVFQKDIQYDNKYYFALNPPYPFWDDSGDNNDIMVGNCGGSTIAGYGGSVSWVKL